MLETTIFEQNDDRIDVKKCSLNLLYNPQVTEFSDFPVPWEWVQNINS